MTYLDAGRISKRDKLILAGLYLSKYDSVGLKRLGFDTFSEAFNAIGYAMDASPAAIKNYRDEFDPLFPNRRKGWHKRATREYCLKLFREYKGLDIDAFTAFIKSFVGYDENAWSRIQQSAEVTRRESNFAQRLITGLAAERYFERAQPSLPQFSSYKIQNTTQLGCGYDFRLEKDSNAEFLAIEVKGLRENAGTVSLAPKEHGTAKALKDRFFLFVVKDFRRTPFHEIFQNPLSGLQFSRVERVTVQFSWVTNL